MKIIVEGIEYNYTFTEAWGKKVVVVTVPQAISINKIKREVTEALAETLQLGPQDEVYLRSTVDQDGQKFAYQWLVQKRPNSWSLFVSYREALNKSLIDKIETSIKLKENGDGHRFIVKNDAERPEKVAQKKEVQLASAIVLGFLGEHKIHTFYYGANEVEFQDLDDFKLTGIEQRLLPTHISEIAKTEGITPRRIGQGEIQTIYINKQFHTVGAIVHEAFHSLSHHETENAGCKGEAIEAMTEYLTLKATKLFLRLGLDGKPIYSNEVQKLREAVDRNKTVTEEDIYNAYFGGDKQCIRKINEVFLGKRKGEETEKVKQGMQITRREGEEGMEKKHAGT